MALFSCIYVISSEFITMLPPRSDILLFQRRKVLSQPRHTDEESSMDSGIIAEEMCEMERPVRNAAKLSAGDGAHFAWSGLTYDIKVGKQTKRILDDVYGWVKPGTLTALMVSISFAVIC